MKIPIAIVFSRGLDRLLGSPYPKLGLQLPHPLMADRGDVVWVGRWGSETGRVIAAGGFAQLTPTSQALEHMFGAQLEL